jgi:hypothetical protein
MKDYKFTNYQGGRNLQLKGLTAADWEEWQQKYAAQLIDYTPYEQQVMYVRSKAFEKYKDNPYLMSIGEKLPTDSLEDWREYYNQDSSFNNYGYDIDTMTGSDLAPYGKAMAEEEFYNRKVAEENKIVNPDRSIFEPRESEGNVESFIYLLNYVLKPGRTKKRIAGEVLNKKLPQEDGTEKSIKEIVEERDEETLGDTKEDIRKNLQEFEEQVAEPTPVEEIQKKLDDARKVFEDVHGDGKNVPEPVKLSETEKIMKQYAGGALSKEKLVNSVKERAKLVSSYYNQYMKKDPELFDNFDWEDLSVTYLAALQQTEDPQKAQEQADYIIAREIQNYLEKHQSFKELAGLAATGFIRSFLGASIEVVGTLLGTVHAIGQLLGSAINPAWGNDRMESGVTDFQHALSTIVGNSINTYADNLMKTGYWTKAKQEAAKAGEIYSKAGPIHTYEHDMGTASVGAQLFNRGTAPEIFSQMGYTAEALLGAKIGLDIGKAVAKQVTKKASIKAAKLVGEAADAAAQAVLKKQAKIATVSAILGGSIPEGISDAVSDYNSVLEKADDLYQEKYNYAYERAVNSLDKDAFYQEAMEMYNDPKNKKYNPETNSYEPIMSVEEVFEFIRNKYDKNIRDRIDGDLQGFQQEAVTAANAAATTVFFADTIINGGIMALTGAALYGTKVQEAFKTNKLFRGLAKQADDIVAGGSRKTGFIIDGYAMTPAEKATARRKAGWANVAKGTFGEGLEEGQQAIWSSIGTSGAMSRLNKYLDFNLGLDSYKDTFNFLGTNLQGAWAGFTDSLSDVNTLRDAVYGAISAGAMSSLNFSSIRRQDILNPTDKKQQRQAIWDSIKAVLKPKLISMYQEGAAQFDEKQQMLESLSQRLNDPEFIGKMHTGAAFLNWMQDATKNLDENEDTYKDAYQAAIASYAFNLLKLERTQDGQALLELFSKVAKSESIEEVQETIAEAKELNGSLYEGMTDQQIYELIKSNAGRMIYTIGEIRAEDERLTALNPGLSEEAKIGLIMSKIDSRIAERELDEINKELTDIEIKNSTEVSPADAVTKNLVAEHGNSTQGIKESIKETEESISEAEKKIKESKDKLNNILENTDETDPHAEEAFKNANALRLKIALYREDVKIAKKYIKEQKKKLRELEKLGEKVPVLSETDIFNLDADKRAKMLDTSNSSKYSEEQNNIIDNLRKQLVDNDIQNIAKIRRTKHLTERVASMKASYYTLLENQEYAAQLSLEASRKAIANLAKNMAEDIMKTSDDIETFIQRVEKAIENNPRPEFINPFKKALRDHPFYQEYRRRLQSKNAVVSQFSKAFMQRDEKDPAKMVVNAVLKDLTEQLGWDPSATKRQVGYLNLERYFRSSGFNRLIRDFFKENGITDVKRQEIIIDFIKQTLYEAQEKVRESDAAVENSRRKIVLANDTFKMGAVKTRADVERITQEKEKREQEEREKRAVDYKFAFAGISSSNEEHSEFLSQIDKYFSILYLKENSLEDAIDDLDQFLSLYKLPKKVENDIIRALYYYYDRPVPELSDKEDNDVEEHADDQGEFIEDSTEESPEEAPEEDAKESEEDKSSENEFKKELNEIVKEEEKNKYIKAIIKLVDKIKDAVSSKGTLFSDTESKEDTDIENLRNKLDSLLNSSRIPAGIKNRIRVVIDKYFPPSSAPAESAPTDIPQPAVPTPEQPSEDAHEKKPAAKQASPRNSMRLLPYKKREGGSKADQALDALNEKFSKRFQPEAYVRKLYEADENGEKETFNGKKVYFVALHKYYEDEALELDEHRLPIAAVVEDENGTMEINGKRYQPIGLMNSSEDDATPGAVVMREIRKSASSLPLKRGEIALITNESGDLYTGDATPPSAKAPTEQETYNSVAQQLLDAHREETKDDSPKDSNIRTARRSKVRELVKKLLKSLAVNKKIATFSEAQYSQVDLTLNNLTSGEDKSTISFFVRPLFSSEKGQEATDKHGRNLAQALDATKDKDGKTDVSKVTEVSKFNYFMDLLHKKMSALLNSNNRALANPDEMDLMNGDVMKSEVEAGYSSFVNNHLGRSLYASGRAFIFNAVRETDDSGKSRIKYTISTIKKTNTDKRELVSFYSDELAAAFNTGTEKQFLDGVYLNFVENLLAVHKALVTEKDQEGDGAFNFQVSYSNFKKLIEFEKIQRKEGEEGQLTEKEEITYEAALAAVIGYFQSDIFETKNDSASYTITEGPGVDVDVATPKKGVSSSTKEKGKGKIQRRSKDVGNMQGDASKKSKTEDSTKNVAEACAEKAKKIVESSRKSRASKSAEGTGRGITSLIHGESSSKTSVQQAIGSIFDGIIRDAAVGELKESYPFIDDTYFKNVIRPQVLAFIEDLTTRGYTFVGRQEHDVRFHVGVPIKVINDGKEVDVTIPMVGELDLLAYNKTTGDWIIIDTKTSAKIVDLQKQVDKDGNPMTPTMKNYQMQLSGYSKMGKAQHNLDNDGANKVTLYILPINLTYLQENFSVEEDGTLSSNDEFETIQLSDSLPRGLNGLIRVNELANLNFKYGNLSESLKQEVDASLGITPNKIGSAEEAFKKSGKDVDKKANPDAPLREGQEDPSESIDTTMEAETDWQQFLCGSRSGSGSVEL